MEEIVYVFSLNQFSGVSFWDEDEAASLLLPYDSSQRSSEIMLLEDLRKPSECVGGRLLPKGKTNVNVAFSAELKLKCYRLNVRYCLKVQVCVIKLRLTWEEMFQPKRQNRPKTLGYLRCNRQLLGLWTRHAVYTRALSCEVLNSFEDRPS